MALDFPIMVIVTCIQNMLKIHVTKIVTFIQKYMHFFIFENTVLHSHIGQIFICDNFLLDLPLYF